MLPSVVHTSFLLHSNTEIDFGRVGAVMGASPHQLCGAVLARLKSEFSLVAMKASHLRRQGSLRLADVSPLPPRPIAFWFGRWWCVLWLDAR